MRVVITRPQEDAGALKAKLEALGHKIIVAPLLTIIARNHVAIPELPWQAIAATSANGIRALDHAPHLRPIRMLTIGPQSLAAARRAGFTRASAHGGDVDGLMRYIHETFDPAAGPILYLSGATTAGDLEAQLRHAGFECVRVVIYDAVPATTLGAAGAALGAGQIDAVLLYSPRSAKVWTSLVKAEGLAAAAAVPDYLCLSRNVAAVLPEAWRISVAGWPDEAAMLALLEQIARTR
jgi:uroporphyrinogen-III synthase